MFQNRYWIFAARDERMRLVLGVQTHDGATRTISGFEEMENGGEER